VRYGQIVGFLGPNGAGKSTALRAVLGLISPDAGRVTVGGSEYHGLTDPARTLGAALDGGAAHPGRTGRAHLRVLATAAGVDQPRVEDVLDLVGLGKVADRRAGEYSLGMRQRLGLAAALLADPAVLVLDEPGNGLDPEGMRWLRNLLRSLADEGRAVLVSSHVLAEVAQTADDIVVLVGGRSVLQAPLEQLLDQHTAGARVAGPDADHLGELLRARGAHVLPDGADAIVVRDRTVEEIGPALAGERLVINELSPVRSSLEEIYLQLTATPNGGSS
jgi:ABC-2 type transport system ATP-binding protein